MRHRNETKNIYIIMKLSNKNTVFFVCSRMRSERERERAAGFSNVKSFTYITLELVDKVHGLAVSMGSYGVSEVGT